MLNLKLSIVTINYNNHDGLLKTVESVIKQSYKNFEYIVIDGGSNDGSINILNEYNNKINYWVSEQDKGIYNAMNKGILVANGEYLLFLNSGDYLVSETTIENFLNDINDYDIIYGRRNTVYNDGRIESFETHSKLTLELFLGGYSIPHQATLIKRQLFLTHGLYDENLKLVSDWKFFIMALFKHNCTYLFKDVYVVNFDGHGISSSESNYKLWLSEIEYVVNAEFRSLLYLKKAIEPIKTLIAYKNSSKIFKILNKLGLFKFLKERIEILETIYD